MDQSTRAQRRTPAALIWIFATLAVFALRPAAAQVTIGSPGEPPRIALELGAFDIVPSPHPDSGAAVDFGLEYRFGDVLWAFSPFVGAMGTSKGGGYGYFGFGFDINLGPNWVLTPNGAAGIYERGSGTKLGSWWEFRTGAELDYKLSDGSRVGVAVHHMSNAGLTKDNPGEESAVLVWTFPFH
ncbi:MAG TPA: acyloxyacyl hydrolase [Stellaceae bacterium]